MRKTTPIMILLSAALLLAALPATDTFSTGTALSASWTVQNSTWAVGSGIARNAVAASEGVALWNADTFASNQYAQAAVSGLSTNNNYVGVIARSTGSGATIACYVFSTDGATGSGHTSLGEFTAGSFAELTGCATTWTAGDVARIEVETSGANAVLRGYKNGSPVCTYTDTTTVKASGSAGLYAWVSIQAQANGNLDNFEAGDLGAPPPSTSVRRGFIIK